MNFLNKLKLFFVSLTQKIARQYFMLTRERAPYITILAYYNTIQNNLFPISEIILLTYKDTYNSYNVGSKVMNFRIVMPFIKRNSSVTETVNWHFIFEIVKQVCEPFRISTSNVKNQSE